MMKHILKIMLFQDCKNRHKKCLNLHMFLKPNDTEVMINSHCENTQSLLISEKESLRLKAVKSYHWPPR